MTANQVASKAPAKTKKKKIASLDKRKAQAGWLFVLPFIIGLVLIYFPIIWESISYSFFNYTPLEGDSSIIVKTFAGFDHYKAALFGDADFAQALLVGLQEMVFNVPAILIFSLFVAVILNQKMVGRAAFRAIFFLPVVLSTGFMESIITQSYNASGDSINLGTQQSTAEELESTMALEGLLASIFEGLGVGSGLVTYITSAVQSISGIINRSGVQILIFLASLQSVSPAIYESCQIDGATAWETFWKITLPMVSPMILVNAIYTIIDSFTTDSNTVMTIIKNTASSSATANSASVSAAMGWMYFLMVLVIVGIVAAVFSAYVFYQRRD